MSEKYDPRAKELGEAFKKTLDPFVCETPPGGLKSMLSRNECPNFRDKGDPVEKGRWLIHPKCEEPCEKCKVGNKVRGYNGLVQ